jgi:hypothetical protein
MLVCKEAARLISASYHRPLNLGERVALRVHLMMCKACTNFKDQARLLHDAARRLNAMQVEGLGELRLSDNARRTIKDALAAGPPDEKG